MDKLIDMAGNAPKGKGTENLRETIVMDKMNFDVASDEWRNVLRERIMGQIERYFYLIVFAMYCKEVR